VLLWFFCFFAQVKLKSFKRAPALIACVVISLICFIRFLQPDPFERLERMTFDMRVRFASRFPALVSTDLGFVFINEESVKKVWDGSVGYHFGLLWPRQVYGALIDELTRQHARAIALDVVCGELRQDHAPVQMADGSLGPESDEYFAQQMRRAGNVIIAIAPEVTPPDLFLTNAAAPGDIFADKDSDGTLRQAAAFRNYRRWHQAFRQMESDPEYAVDLAKARVEPGRVVLPRPAALGDIIVPLNANGEFDLADFGGTNLPAGMPRHAKPFSEMRVWHMGIILAARALQLDLTKPEIDLEHGGITLRGPAGVERVLPVDSAGYFFIDWSLPVSHPQLTREAIHDLLAQHRARLEGHTNELTTRWRDKLAVVGSSAVIGNNLTDRGATPLSRDTLLVSEYWNVANSLLMGNFVRRAPLWLELVLVIVLGLATTFLTWRLRVLTASIAIAILAVAYIGLALALYVQTRYWLPLVLPVGGALLMNYVSLIAWRAIFEQAEQRRIRAVFSTVVSPKIVRELLQKGTLKLGGVRREVTVLFADVRGFTEFTDASQEQVADWVRRNKITGSAAEACFDEQAHETLETINRYLGLVAETIIQQDGTLDKFIGDCVMAFWGAPTPNPQHASACVRAAIQAQCAIYALNRQRLAENQRREAENQTRLPAGLPPRPFLPILFLGTGINTGMATVGLMGAESKAIVRQGSYTVFGREVNLASRLEGRSGRGRILITEATFQRLKAEEPALAAACIALPPISDLKGIRGSIQIYEVPWRQPDAQSLEEEFATRIPFQTAASFTVRDTELKRAARS
jgi:class 3 adenylate cyclase/CHASE2 domain-containing sensor protein